MSGTKLSVYFPDGMLTPSTKMTELEKIDAGGFCEVFKAEHADWGTVAYKKLPQSFIQVNNRTVKQMMREVHILNKLRHPNIVTITGVVFEEGNYGIVLEFVPLGNVDKFLQDFKVSLPLKAKLVHDVVLGMNYLHNRNTPIIHGDLKIQNILVTDGYHGKISDFGLSNWKEMSKTSTKRTSITGTVTHISPERWTDINMDPTVKEDIYAFGVLLWEIFTELKPFSNLDPNAIMSVVRDGQRPDVRCLPSDLPPLLVSMIQTSWTANPDERKSFKDIKVSLGAYITCHAAEIESAKHNIQRQDSCEWYPSSSDAGSCLQSVDTNHNLPVQRRHTDNLHTLDQQETAPVVTGNPLGVAGGSDVPAQHPLPPTHLGPNQTAPGGASLTSLSPATPSLCLDGNRNRTNLLVNSAPDTLFPIQESAGRASANTMTFDPRVPQGQGLVSLHSEMASSVSRLDFTDGSEIHVKEVAGDVIRPLASADEGGSESFQGLVSVHSNPPTPLDSDPGVLGSCGHLELRSERDSGRERGYRMMSGSHSSHFGEEGSRTRQNKPCSLLEADATMSPEHENRAPGSDESRSNSMPCQQLPRKDAGDKLNVSMKSVLENWNKNTDYNNLGAGKGYYPKDGGSFKEHKALPLLPNIQNPDSSAGNNEPTGGCCPHQPPRKNHEETGRLPGSPKSSHRVPPTDTCDGCTNIPNIPANSPSMKLIGEGKEITINGCNGIGPYVQFGNNNTMTITTPARPLPCPGSSSFWGQPGSSTRPKGSKKKEKITVPDRLVDSDVILIVAEHLGKDWTRLARQLDIRDSDIGSYEVDYHHLGVKEVSYQMLRGWVEKKGPEARLERLAKALVAIGRPDLAKQLSSCALEQRRTV